MTKCENMNRILRGELRPLDELFSGTPKPQNPELVRKMAELLERVRR